LRNALDRWPDEVCSIEADRERERSQADLPANFVKRPSRSLRRSKIWLAAGERAAIS